MPASPRSLRAALPALVCGEGLEGAAWRGRSLRWALLAPLFFSRRQADLPLLSRLKPYFVEGRELNLAMQRLMREWGTRDRSPELRQARALYFPSIDLRAAAGPEYSNSVTTRNRVTRAPGSDASTTLMRWESQLTLTQMLFDGFATQSEVDRQLERINSAAYRLAAEPQPKYSEFNPRYERDRPNPRRWRWLAHLEHAASMTLPGGRLVAILPESARNKKLLPGWATSWGEVYRFPGTSITVSILTAEKSA